MPPSSISPKPITACPSCQNYNAFYFKAQNLAHDAWLELASHVIKKMKEFNWVHELPDKFGLAATASTGQDNCGACVSFSMAAVIEAAQIRDAGISDERSKSHYIGVSSNFIASCFAYAQYFYTGHYSLTVVNEKCDLSW